KRLLDEKGMSIRALSAQTEIPFETLRRLYNDTTIRYERSTLGKVCETLNIELSELLVLVDGGE
ncbi:helix-turn-helix transcriptional regulator, partial [Heyndrickxia acidicola]|nr:helix-turn-helix transcriptional regulator [Heyndrickxia acidicola]